MQRENSCFVNIGSLCSLAQQALLCITLLRTEVLNNIFILPVDVSSLFGDNTVRFWYAFPFLRVKDAADPQPGIALWRGRSGYLPPGTFLLGVCCLQWVSHVMVGLPSGQQRHLMGWPDGELSAWANQLQRDQMGRQTKIATYPSPSWKCRRAALEV